MYHIKYELYMPMKNSLTMRYVVYIQETLNQYEDQQNQRLA